MEKVRILFRLSKFTIKYKWKVLFLIFLSLISVGFSVLQPLPIKYIIDSILSNNPLPQRLVSIFNLFGGVPGKQSLIIIFVSCSVLLVVGTSILSFFSSNITIKVCQRLVHDFSSALFDKMQNLSLSFYSKNNVGDLMQRLSGDTYVIYSLVGAIMLPTLQAITTLVCMFCIMASINTTLALLAISVTPLFGILIWVFNKPMTRSSIYQSEISGKLWSHIHQSLTSVKIIQAYAQEKFTREQYKSQSLEYNNASVTSSKIAMIYTGLIAVVSGIATSIVVGIGAYKGLNGSITTGELFLFISYIAALFGPVNSLASIIANIFTITSKAKRVFDILDSKEVIIEKENAAVLLGVKGKVELKNIDFGYTRDEGRKPILNDLNLKVEAGQTIAIVGPTGAGKTSLISLLLRFYDPWNGNIFIDGTNIKDVTIQSLRSHISLVLQDSCIFPISIAENISFGSPNASRDEIISAAKAAQAHDFIMKLPEGYDTIPSEGGVSLSGGEKQRLSLARAFLKDAAIMIFDEPTSALDVQTEAKIFKALATYAAGKTVFIISHRLSTIRHADLIISIKDGIIHEQGTHETLIKEGKVYADLHQFQYVV